MYKIGENGAAFRVFPMKIEEVICSCEDVFRCAVVGKKHPEKAYVSVAFVVLKDENADKVQAESNILNICRRELSLTSMPDEIRFVSALPMTSAGKVDFKALEKSLE